MVRAVKLETSASGTYYNPSQGEFGSTRQSSVNVAKAAAPVKTVAIVKPQAKADISTALGRDLPPTGATSTDTVWFDDSIPRARFETATTIRGIG